MNFLFRIFHITLCIIHITACNFLAKLRYAPCTVCLISCTMGLSTMWMNHGFADSFTTELTRRVVDDIAEEVPNAIRICTEGTVEIVDENDEAMVLTDQEQVDLIGQVIDGQSTGVGKNRLVRVEHCNSAQIKLTRIRVMHRRTGTLARAELMQNRGGRWTFLKTVEIPISAAATETPRVESSAPQPPPSDRVSISKPDVTARHQPDIGPEGGFGIRLIVDGKPVRLQRSEKLNLFLAKGLPDRTEFEIELVNHYPVEAAAAINLDGTARFQDESGNAILDYVDSAANSSPGTRRLTGWGIAGDNRNGQAFRLRKDDLHGQQKHHVEVKFHFASQDRDKLLALESDAPTERGYSVTRGRKIVQPTQLVKYHIGRVREIVKIAFVD